MQTEPLREQGSPRACTQHTGALQPEQIDKPATKSWQLGPPIREIADDVSTEQLQVFRERYQAFRAGEARGAKGEVADISSGLSTQAMMSRIHAPGHCLDEDYEDTREVGLLF